MFYVYVLQSESQTDQTYVGSTQDLRRRLGEHNSGKSAHTRKFVPWRLIFYAAFPEKPFAEKFERYLKSGSGRAFARKHLFSVKR
jgi:putative endonuclease